MIEPSRIRGMPQRINIPNNILQSDTGYRIQPERITERNYFGTDTDNDRMMNLLVVSFGNLNTRLDQICERLDEMSNRVNEIEEAIRYLPFTSRENEMLGSHFGEAQTSFERVVLEQ